MTADLNARTQRSHELARLIMEAVAAMHERGYGRLKCIGTGIAVQQFLADRGAVGPAHAYGPRTVRLG
jgi:hypothetical protein